MNLNVQVVVVDFGKATEKDRGRLYTLNFHEKQQYRFRYRHLAPELIEGTMKQCVLSDIYSLGKLLGQITNSARLVGLEDDSLGRVQQLIQACTTVKPKERPNARRICEVFEQILKKLF